MTYNWFNPEPKKTWSRLVDFVDRIYYVLHPRRNAFWDGVPEPEPVPSELADIIEPWDTDPHGLTGPIKERCRKCGMPAGTGCRTPNGQPCGAHKERREDADAGSAVG
ncbi:MAG: hypothetical protein ACRDOK_01735 [Streptosporangiaceae bacterium]